MKRITLGEFKEITRGLPDNAIICCQSDSEGNEKSTCLDVFIEQVGKPQQVTGYGNDFNYVEGDDIYNIDLVADKDRVIITLQPSL